MKYELKLTKSERVRFIAAVKHEMTLNACKIKDLADSVGYKPSSIYEFFSNPDVENKFLAAEIADKLNLKEWSDKKRVNSQSTSTTYSA